MARKLSNWLLSYENYVDQTESPKDYDIWCGISVLSAALKRNCWIDYFPYKIYASQYIVLIGPPGIGKGTAINPAVGLAKEAGVVNYIPDRITAEKIVERLTNGFGQGQKLPTGQMAFVQDSCATIVSTELPIFLQTSEWMMPLMCDVWDKGEFSYDTKTKNTYNAKDICVGLIAGCVPDYIRKLNKDSTTAITGGFTSRCIFVYATEKSRIIAWPTNNGHHGLLKQDLIDDLKQISTLKGTFNFTKKAHELYESWYNAQKSDQFESEVLNGFKARMKSHILKTCMSLAVAESDKLEVNENHMFNSMKLLNDIKNKVDITFRSIGESPIAAAQERIRMFIDKHPLYNFQQIMKNNYRHVTAEQLQQILFVLKSAGIVEELNQGGKSVYTVPRVVSMGRTP